MAAPPASVAVLPATTIFSFLPRAFRFPQCTRSNSATVIILFCINLLNYMDRFTIAGIPDMIRAYYHIDSMKLGLLQTSFIISYMAFSPLFGYLGDRYNRKLLMILGIFVWTMVTFASSFVPPSKFALFLSLRCMVGVGEACYSTLAPTILTDLFSGNSRTSVLGFFYFAVPVGSGLGFALGSVIAHSTHNWAWALRTTPILGLLFLLSLGIFYTDPPRGRADGVIHLHTTSWLSDLRSLSSNRCFLLLSVGFMGNCFVLGALSWFSVDYIQEAINTRGPQNAPDPPIALLFGLSACFSGLLGVVVGTLLAQRLRIYFNCIDAYISGASLLLSAPFVFASLLTPFYNLHLCLVFVFFGQFLICMNWALIPDMTMSVVIPTRRATANAFQTLLTHAFGDAISPFIIGTIVDVQQNSSSATSRYLSMQRALFINVYVCVISGFLFLCTSWYLESAKASAQSIIDEASRVGSNCTETERRLSLSGGDYGTITHPSTWFPTHSRAVIS